jgi:alpha-tubulin suppressor-like RCC1 family protein
MPNPTTNFIYSNGGDLGNALITKEYLISVYPIIAGQLITPDLWVWGSNAYGKLGDGTAFVDRSTPVTTSAGGSNWRQVATASDHTVAIKTDGSLWVWGRNVFGQLGTNTSGDDKYTPVTTFAGGTNWKQTFCGSNHTAAIKTDGTLWTWGYNFYGQLGNNITSIRSIPVTTFAGGTNWKQTSCGSAHTAAIKTDGTLWIWGYNTFVQLGDNTTTNRSIPVTTFIGGTNWKEVSCGGLHTAAIKTDGTLWAWGTNTSGQLGDNTVTYRTTPVTTFSGGNDWKVVSSGSAHITAIKNDGTLWTWGRNSVRALGDNTAINKSTPVTTFAGGTNWKQVSCGSNHTAVIKTDGSLWIWGYNLFGQVGNNTSGNNISTPVTTSAGGTNWKQVAGGYNYTLAIKNSDDLQGI